MNKVKCKLCDRVFIDKRHLILHIDKAHSSQIPAEWSASQYENYLRTGRTHGTCVICKCDTPWNSTTGKYCRMCTKSSCRQKARELAEQNLIKSKGITHSQMLKDPEFQRKMVYSKRTSGLYKFNDNRSTVDVMYDSSFGKDFLEMCENFMNFLSCDIMGPSPNTYAYKYNGEWHFYIPDFYIPSLHLEVEIKDGGDNPNMHPKIQAVDKVKESLKDKAMTKEKVNYVKIVNKNYSTFFKTLYLLKEQNTEIGGKNSFVTILESVGDQHSTSIDTVSTTVMWFYKQANELVSDADLVSLNTKLEATMNYMKSSLNSSDPLSQNYHDLKQAIVDLESLKTTLEYQSFCNQN